jgi:hypothetical protein
MSLTVTSDRRVDVYFQWGPVLVFIPGNEVSREHANDKFFLYIDDLTPGTTYYFRGVAIDGEKIFGNERSFATVPSSPPQF